MRLQYGLKLAVLMQKLERIQGKFVALCCNGFLCSVDRASQYIFVNNQLSTVLFYVCLLLSFTYFGQSCAHYQEN